MSLSVLIVAQHATLRQSLGDWLTIDLPDCQVFHAACPTEAVRVIERRALQAIIVDIHEPWVEGLEMLRNIHASAPDTPLIAIGLNETETHRGCALAAGATTYICKVDLQNELVPALKHAFKAAPSVA